MIGGPVTLFLLGFVGYYFHPRYTDVGYTPVQPVPYSHKFHVGTLGLDCRYCHTGVEVGAHANVPPTSTCMNCHGYIKTDSELLSPIRLSYSSGDPVDWVRVHKLPDYVRFRHDVHVEKGVSCYSCHGRVDQMVEVRQAEPLNMGWCLDCHRDPAKNLVEPEKVTDLEYVQNTINSPTHASGLGLRLVESNNINPPENCSACHF